MDFERLGPVEAGRVVEGKGGLVLRPHHHLGCSDLPPGELVDRGSGQASPDAGAAVRGVHGEGQELCWREVATGGGVAKSLQHPPSLSQKSRSGYHYGNEAIVEEKGGIEAAEIVGASGEANHSSFLLGHQKEARWRAGDAPVEEGEEPAPEAREEPFADGRAMQVGGRHGIVPTTESNDGPHGAHGAAYAQSCRFTGTMVIDRVILSRSL